MEKREVFCEECRNDVSYNVNEIKMEGILKGEKYPYQGKIAYCDACGSEVYVAEFNDYNLRALYDEYRKKNGIVSLDTILTIPKKYAIGKRPLSILLGWGEQTFSRYCDGDMPTKQYSEILQKIYDDPLLFQQILENNKKNLKPSSYEKSKNALNSILGNSANMAKIDITIEYLLNQCEDITPLSLQKALYYIQGFYSAFYEEFLFDEDCEAWIHGPVYRDIYFRYRNYRFDPILSNSVFDSSVFSSEEKAILDSVIKNICCYSGKVLEIFTHSEKPWLLTRGKLPANAVSEQIIQKELIKDYFDAIKNKYNMINPKDIKVYTKDLFEQI